MKKETKRALLGGGLFTLVYGSMIGILMLPPRETKNEHSFVYRGKPAIVQSEYYLLRGKIYKVKLSDGEIIRRGRIIGDNGENISIRASSCWVDDKFYE